jgi:hypothetical protein
MGTAKTCALYGFSSDLPPFVDKTPDEQVALLQSWGNDVVFGGYHDPAFVDAAHRAGMPVYAEFGCFVGQHWWQAFPESRPVTETGALLDPEGGENAWYCGVNPAHPAVRQQELAKLEELLTSYAIDGVWLDFIRWPCHWEVHDPYLPLTSFDPGTVRRFCQDAGIDPIEGEVSAVAQEMLGRHGDRWTVWRCDQVTSWVAAAREVVDRVRPGAVLGLFGVPWRLTDREGAILRVIGQDYKALGPYVDVFSPMVYHRMCGYPPVWIADVTDKIHALSGKPVWPIVQSVDDPEPLPADEYGAALDAALASPASEGVLVFTLKGALAEDKLRVTRERFV